MALGAVLGAALTDHSAHPFTLTVGGLDIIRDPGTGGNKYGVPVDSITVDVATPGTISSMSFDFADPLGAQTLSLGDRVEFWDNNLGEPMFVGWLITASYRPSHGGQGRTAECQALGIETVLDWASVPSVTFAASTPGWDAVQTLCGMAQYAGTGLRYAFQFGGGVGGNYLGDLAHPLGDFGGLTTTAGTVTPAGTLRSAIQYLLDNGRGGIVNLQTAELFVTVDFYGGLRGWYQRANTYTDMPDDYATMTVTDTVGSSLNATDLQHVEDAGSVVRAVRVIGGNAAGTGTVSDGTGLPGRVSTIVDSTILTADAMAGRGAAEIANNVQTARGTFTLDDISPIAAIHPGSQLVLTDTASSATGTYRLSGLGRTFHSSGRQVWTVNYGAAVPSFVNTLGRI
jgi:hypothetical protein